MENKHIPVRECIVCGKKVPKAHLVRIAKSGDEIFLDLSQKSGGRGAYICKDTDCYDKLLKKRRLDRAFKRSVDNSVYEEILKEIDQTDG